MPILSLVKRSNSETIRLLESMLNEARRGEVEDVLIAYRRRNRAEDLAAAGVYRHDPGAALRGIVMLKARLIQAALDVA